MFAGKTGKKRKAVAVIMMLAAVLMFAGCKAKKDDKGDTFDEKSVSEKVEEDIDFDETIESATRIGRIYKEKFDLSYYKTTDVDGNEVYYLSTPDGYGYINYEYRDFDNDGEKEILVVTLAEDAGEEYLALYMLEKKDGKWIQADSIQQHNGDFLAKTNSYICPERCDVYIGGTDTEPLIYMETEYVSSYFADGIGVLLYQLVYKGETFFVTQEPLFAAGSAIDDLLQLDEKLAEEMDDLGYYNNFKQMFDGYGLKLTDGMYYETPLYSQNENLTYVAGYNKYAEISFDEMFAWQNDNANGELTGVVLEVSGEYMESHKTDKRETDDKQKETGDSVSVDEWKQAYYDYLKKMDLNGYDGFSLLYVNDDEVPELYLYGNCEAMGQIYATYHKGQVNFVRLSRLSSLFSERGNLIINDDGSADYYYDIFYTIENGIFVKTHMGESHDYYDEAADTFITNYTWDGEAVSDEEYGLCLKRVIGSRYTVNPPIQFSNAEDMFAYLQ